MKTKTIISIAFFLISIQTFSQTKIPISTVYAVSSSLSSNTTPNNAYDLVTGNPNLTSYWSPATNSNSEYIIFDLGSANTYKLTQIVINFTSLYPYVGLLSASTNNSTWDPLSSNINGTNIIINLSGTQLYRYIKLTNLAVYGTSSPAQLTDISIYYSPSYNANDITVNRNLYANNLITAGTLFTMQTTQGILYLLGNASNFNFSTDKSYFNFSKPVTIGTITTSNINSTGDCSIQGTTISGSTSGAIKVFSPYLSGAYYNGGDVTITAGTGFKNGNININATAGQNNSGQIYLNGATNVTGSLSATGSLTTTGAISASSLTTTGTISASSLTTTGTITAANLNVTTGSVGIGTNNPTSYKLAVNGAVGVNGTIYATKVLVQTSVSFPDYVFNNNYKLKSLAETETYIKANKHLEGVPTETEVKEKGIDVGEMNTILLKKVEEMTLLLIEQNKRIEKLEKENSSSKNK